MMSRLTARLKEGGHLAFGYDVPFSSYFVQKFYPEDSIPEDNESGIEWEVASNSILVMEGSKKPKNSSNGEIIDALMECIDAELVVEEDIPIVEHAIYYVVLDLEIPQRL